MNSSIIQRETDQNVRVALVGEAENQEPRIPWAYISVPVDLISIWIVEVENRLFHRLKGTGLKLCDNRSS